MRPEGIEAIYLETHNWGKSTRFFQALGFTIDFETDHESGMLRNGDGPYVFIAEVPESHETRMQVVLKVADADAFKPDPIVEVVSPFEMTHFGAREMTVRDPDGRSWVIQAPGVETGAPPHGEP